MLSKKYFLEIRRFKMSNVSNAFGAVVCKEGKRLKGGRHPQKLGLQSWTVKEIVS
jgi:hypothetical protein